MSSYRALLARPGAARLAVSSGIAWWGFTGYGLALVLAVQYSTGSFAAAGGATAAFAGGSALLAPLRGRAVDRAGAPALLALAVVHSAAAVALLVACAQHRPGAWIVVLPAALAGASVPPLVATSRTAWAQIAGAPLARTAHALSATLGEAASVVSPVATSAIAAAASPVVALGLLVPAVGVAAVGIAGVATSPAPAPARRRSRPSLLRVSPGLRWLMVGDVASGIWLGALEVSAAALSLDAGGRLLAGVPLFGLAAGGISATLWTGSSHSRGGSTQRYVWGSVAAAVVLPLALIHPSVGLLTVVATLGGVSYGLLNVALFELIDAVADRSRTIEAFTWITSAQAAGLAVGSAAAGALADVQVSHALLLLAVTPTVGALAALSGRGRLSHDQRASQPEPGSPNSTRP